MLAVAFAALALTAPQARAHGAPEVPISRQYNCYKNPQLPACRAAVEGGLEQALYDWNGVNQGAANGNHEAVVPNGTLCGGGKELYRGFNLARNDWYSTPWAPGADGVYEFRYHATAPHSTLYMRFYLTRNGFDPAARPLQWSDLDLVAEVPRSQITTTPDSRYVTRLNLPSRSGRHVLFVVWQRADSQEAFYACSDVSFNSVDPPTVSYTHLGQIAAQRDLPIGAVLNLRVFGPAGADLESHQLTVSSATQTAAAWLAQLASRVNTSSAYLRVGSLLNGNITIPADSTLLQVYALGGSPSVTYQLDTTLPPNNPPGENTWVEGASYTVGQVVTYEGKSYRCLQAHTAWKGAGWYPSATGVLDILWAKI